MTFMKKTLHLLLLLALSTIPAWSQTCSVAALKTQADVDNFSASYPGCTVVNGDLQIIASNITNLDSLHDVNRITGLLKINYNPNLTSIAGLSSLGQIDAGLSIEGNDNLLTLNGLDHLSSVKTISIANNKKLTSISALSGLTRILGSLSIGSNPALTSLNGLHNVTRVRAVVLITSNDNLLDLTGLRKLR